MKKTIFALLTILSTNVYAVSLPVTEGMVNSQVEKSFPKTIKKVELSNPKITLLDSKSIICMDGIPRIMFLQKPFKMCASFNPHWNAKESRLEATHMELTSVDIQGVGSIPPSLNGILSEVLVMIEPLSLYRSDSWLTKQISSIEVGKGVMYLNF
jgi:hypothetical protein